METNNKAFAAQIEAGTKKMVEAGGQKYEPTKLDNLDIQSSNESELQQLTNTLVGQINEGTEKDKEYNAWYEKEYGTKNTHISSSTVTV